MNIDDITKLEAAVKEMKREVIKRNKMSAKLAEMTFENSTNKRRGNARADLNWQCMEIEKLTYKCHALGVDCGIADVREPEYYETRTFEPDGFHEFLFEPPRPKSII